MKLEKLAVGLALLISGITPSWSQPLARACHSVSVTGQLNAGQKFQQIIGGDLVFQISPENLGSEGELDGWSIKLSPRSSPLQDYIYPVNPPIRFNGLQTIGPSYGDDAKSSLGHPHRMRFLLGPNDYGRIEPLLTAALWPSTAPHPDTAGVEYLDGLTALRTGTAVLTVLSYELQPGTESIRRMKFRIVFTAPSGFKFEPHLRPKPCSCPAPWRF